MEQSFARYSTKDEASQQSGKQHRQGDWVGVLAEPRDVRDADLTQVTENAERGTDTEDVGVTDASKRGVDVFAVTQMPSVPGIDGGRNSTSEGDVRAHEGAEGQVVQAEGISGCGKHSPGGQHAEAGEDEGVVAADGGKESEDEDSDRGGEHRCSFVRAGYPAICHPHAATGAAFLGIPRR